MCPQGECLGSNTLKVIVLEEFGLSTLSFNMVQMLFVSHGFMCGTSDHQNGNIEMP